MARRIRPSAPVAPAGRIEPQRVVVLYHRRTGAIAHTHYFSATAGGRLPDEQELERIACEQAERDGYDLGIHGALHVDPAQLRAGTAYRVSVARRALVAVKAGRRGPQRMPL